MALVIKDRVKETTLSVGVGTITLDGASAGFNSFSDIGNANTTYYCIASSASWEVGIGTYTLIGTTLSRNTVLSNNLGTTALINFSAGSKDVFCTYPSSKAILGNTSAVTSTGTGSVVFSTSPTFAVDITTPKANVFKSGFGINVGNDNTIGTSSVGSVENIIFGISNNASLGNAFAIGAANTVTGDLNSGGFSFGYGNTVDNSYGNGDFSNTVGFNNSLSVGGNSNAFGNNNVTSASGASVFGNDITNTIANSVMIGASNSSKVTILSTGNVGIGTASPQGKLDVNGTIRTAGYTVATLPAGTIGMRAYVTDALAPTFLAAVIGGGTVKEPVFYNGTNWLSA